MAFDNPCGRNANDAAMPTLSVDHHAKCFAKLGILLEAVLNLLHNAALFVLPFTIQLVKTRSQFTHPRHIFLTEEFNNISRHIHAACRIEARCNSKSNFTRSERSRGTQLGNLQQRLKSRVHWSPQCIESKLREYSVLPGERNGIGYRRNRK